MGTDCVLVDPRLGTDLCALFARASAGSADVRPLSRTSTLWRSRAAGRPGPRSGSKEPAQGSTRTVAGDSPASALRLQTGGMDSRSRAAIGVGGAYGATTASARNKESLGKTAGASCPDRGISPQAPAGY